MSGDRSADLRKQLADEVWEELSSLKGQELEDYLASIGLKSEELLDSFSKAKAAAVAAPLRARFEEARRLVGQRRPSGAGKILAFEPARKKQILEALKDHPEMTRAARNGRIEDDSDVDAFLEACLRLGVIDADGNVKD
jgi:hypothetical protein